MRFYRCRCFLRENYFLKTHRLHVNYQDRQQLLRDHGKSPLTWWFQELQNAGCRTPSDLEKILAELDGEYQRRLASDSASAQRQRHIAEKYVALHPHLYTISESYLDKRFLDLSKLCRQPGTTVNDIKNLQYVIEEHAGQRVYSFPVFAPDFCRQLLEEINHFEKSGMPTERPNTMHNSGVMLGEMGFNERFLDPLRDLYLKSVTSVFYPEWGGMNLDSHRAFTVVYEEGGDEELALHYDNAEVTLNVCLGDEFEGGELYFGNMWDDTAGALSFKKCAHKLHHGLLHRGRHRHGAMPLEFGKRHNLIMWLRSSSVRNALCPRCRKQPGLVPSQGYGDGFTLTDSAPEKTRQT